MGSRRTWITTNIWMDIPFQQCSKEEQFLWLYLMTSPFSNLAGFYRLTPNYVELAVGKECLEYLYKPSKFFKYDAASNQVLLPNYLHYNTASSAQQFKAIAKEIDNLKLCPLMKDFLIAMKRWCQPIGFAYLGEAIKKYITYLIEVETNEIDLVNLKAIKEYMAQPIPKKNKDTNT